MHRTAHVFSRLAIVVLLPALGAGCFTARVRPDLGFAGSWAEDPAKDREMKSFLEEQEDLYAPIEPAQIEVWVGKIPAGLKLENNVLSVSEGAPYEILGRGSFLVNGSSFMGFQDFEDGWRKGVCYPQVPLTWVTLGLWGLIPTYYACTAENEKPKEDVLTGVRNLVARLGGDLFVGEYIFAGEAEASGMVGFVIRRLGAEPAQVAGKTAI